MSELELMHDNLNGQQTPQAQVIVGMGGIGKTELATEYVHHNRDKYKIIWWIRAEHLDRVRDALVKLAQRSEGSGRRPQTVLPATGQLRRFLTHFNRKPGQAGSWCTTTQLTRLSYRSICLPADREGM